MLSHQGNRSSTSPSFKPTLNRSLQATRCCFSAYAPCLLPGWVERRGKCPGSRKECFFWRLLSAAMMIPGILAGFALKRKTTVESGSEPARCRMKDSLRCTRPFFQEHLQGLFAITLIIGPCSLVFVKNVCCSTFLWYVAASLTWLSSATWESTSAMTVLFSLSIVSAHFITLHTHLMLNVAFGPVYLKYFWITSFLWLSCLTSPPLDTSSLSFRCLSQALPINVPITISMSTGNQNANLLPTPFFVAQIRHWIQIRRRKGEPMYLVPYFDAAALSPAQLRLQKRYLHRLVKSSITSKVCIRHQSHNMLVVSNIYWSQGLQPTPITHTTLFPSRHFRRFFLSLSFFSLFFLPSKSEPRLLIKSAMPRKKRSKSLQSRRGQHRCGWVYANSNCEKGFMKNGVTVAWQITYLFFFFCPFFFSNSPPEARRRGAHSNPFFRPFRLSVEECEWVKEEMNEWTNAISHKWLGYRVSKVESQGR